MFSMMEINLKIKLFIVAKKVFRFVDKVLRRSSGIQTLDCVAAVHSHFVNFVFTFHRHNVRPLNKFDCV